MARRSRAEQEADADELVLAAAQSAATASAAVAHADELRMALDAAWHEIDALRHELDSCAAERDAARAVCELEKQETARAQRAVVETRVDLDAERTLAAAQIEALRAECIADLQKEWAAAALLTRRQTRAARGAVEVWRGVARQRRARTRVDELVLD